MPTFWNKLSDRYKDFPPKDVKILENLWTAMGRIGRQVDFDIANLLGSISPHSIPPYNTALWMSFDPDSPEDLSDDLFSIPTLRTGVVKDPYLSYVEGTDYDLIGKRLVWTSLGPDDGDMELAGFSDWTAIGSPTITKDITTVYLGTRSLKVDGDVSEGVKSNPVTVVSNDFVRVTLFAQLSTENFDLILYDETNGAVIATSAAQSGTSWARKAVSGTIPSDCISVSIRAVLNGTDALFLDEVDITRYPDEPLAWAPLVLRYNPYVDTRFGNLFRFKDINKWAWSPKHAKQVMRCLNYAYIGGDTVFALKAGINAIAGLPFAYEAGIVKSAETVDSDRKIVITDENGVDVEHLVPSSLAVLSDLPVVDDVLIRYEPFIDSVRVREEGPKDYVPIVDNSWPTDGDMETGGTANYSQIGTVTLSKDTNEQSVGTQCLKVVTDTADEGVQPAVDLVVVAGETHRFFFHLKVDDQDKCIVRVQIYDETQSAVIVEDWFMDTAYELEFIDALIPTGCTAASIRLTTIDSGTFFVDELFSSEVFIVESHRADKTGADKISTYLDTPLEATDVVKIRNLNTGVHEIRKVSSVAAVTEILTNPGFETDTASPPANWDDVGNHVATAVADGTAPEGSNVAEVVASAAGGYGSNIFRFDITGLATIGKRYTQSIYVKWISGNTAFKLRSNINNVTSEISQTIDGTWTQLSVTFVADADSGSQYFEMFIAGAGTFRVDAASLKEAYVDVITLDDTLHGDYALGTDMVTIQPFNNSAGFTTKLRTYMRWETPYFLRNMTNFLENIRDRGNLISFLEVVKVINGDLEFGDTTGFTNNGLNTFEVVAAPGGIYGAWMLHCIGDGIADDDFSFTVPTTSGLDYEVEFDLLAEGNGLMSLFDFYGTGLDESGFTIDGAGKAIWRRYKFTFTADAATKVINLGVQLTTGNNQVEFWADNFSVRRTV